MNNTFLKVVIASIVSENYLRYSSRVLMSICFVAGIQGCATISSDKTQPITLQATCSGEIVSGATCELTNSKGSYAAQTPGSISINKSFGDLTIACKKGAAAGAVTLKSSSTGMTWGNILLGGGIGALVDMKTGAGYEYQNSVTVPMIGECNGNVADTDFKPTTELNDNIVDLDTAKSKCTELGFTPATEKFGECVLKLGR